MTLNPKMLSSSVRSTLVAGTAALVYFLTNHLHLSADQAVTVAGVIIASGIGLAAAIWGILEKKDPKQAAEVVAIAHMVGVDPDDLLGLNASDVAKTLIAAIPPVHVVSGQTAPLVHTVNLPQADIATAQAVSNNPAPATRTVGPGGA